MQPTLKLAKVRDFEITGDGSDPVWSKVEPAPLTGVAAPSATYATSAKTVYSESGLYFLFDCVDQRLTCTLTEDFADLYNEDVVEVFLQPDPSQPLYFEYEASPLGFQLPILVPHHNYKFCGWRPWHVEDNRLTRLKTAIRGGPKQSMATVTGWTAEFFIPFDLLIGFPNVPPSPGTIWRANMYRIDYDQLPQSHWAWSPDTQNRFHDYHNFGSFLFD